MGSCYITRGALQQPRGVGWGKGWEAVQGGDICILTVEWQKPTQHCKAISLQLKKNHICICMYNVYAICNDIKMLLLYKVDFLKLLLGLNTFSKCLFVRIFCLLIYQKF